MYPKLSTVERCSFLRDSGDRQEVIREIWEKTKNTREINYWQIAIVGCLLGVLAIAIALLFRRIKNSHH
jgi:spermidine/putrescine transport system substrate-binding protein